MNNDITYFYSLKEFPLITWAIPWLLGILSLMIFQFLWQFMNPKPYKIKHSSSKHNVNLIKSHSNKKEIKGKEIELDESEFKFTKRTDYNIILEDTIEGLLSDQLEHTWNHITTTKGVIISGHSDTDGTTHVNKMKGEAKLSHPIEKVLQLVVDLDKRKKWDKLIIENRLIEQVDEITSISYSAFRGVFPVSGRDLCILSTVREMELEDGIKRVIVASSSITHPKVPNTKYVRAELFSGGFILEELPDSSGTQITFIAQLDLKGSVPQALVNMLAQRQPLCIARITDILDKEVKEREGNGEEEIGARREVFPKVVKHPLLRDMELFLSAGVWDVLSAKLAERAGFNSIVVSGYAVAGTLLGEPDFGLLTQSEVLEVARRVCRAVKIPVIVDGDTGYGSALNVIRMVKECIYMGARGIILEDQTWPKRCGHMSGKSVISMEEHVQKIKAAVAAKSDNDMFMITARTDARCISIDEAIKRANAYKEAGADFIFVEGPESIEEIRRIAMEVPPPIVLNFIDGGKTPFLPLDECHKLGFMSVGYVLTGLFASVRAMENAFAHLIEHGTSKGLDLSTFKHYTDIVGLPQKLYTDSLYKVE